MKKEISEYGKGFIYNLILFAKHWAIESISFSYWFNGAGDHFFEFEIPEQFKKKKIGKLAEKLQNKVLLFRTHPYREPTERDFRKVFEMLEELAMLIDEELGIKPVKAEWN